MEWVDLARDDKELPEQDEYTINKQMNIKRSVETKKVIKISSYNNIPMNKGIKESKNTQSSDIGPEKFASKVFQPTYNYDTSQNNQQDNDQEYTNNLPQYNFNKLYRYPRLNENEKKRAMRSLNKNNSVGNLHHRRREKEDISSRTIQCSEQLRYENTSNKLECKSRVEVESNQLEPLGSNAEQSEASASEFEGTSTDDGQSNAERKNPSRDRGHRHRRGNGRTTIGNKGESKSSLRRARNNSSNHEDTPKVDITSRTRGRIELLQTVNINEMKQDMKEPPTKVASKKIVLNTGHRLSNSSNHKPVRVRIRYEITERGVVGGKRAISHASLGKLVARLSDAHQYDAEFRDVFLLTYRCFCSTYDFIKKMMKRYNAVLSLCNNIDAETLALAEEYMLQLKLEEQEDRGSAVTSVSVANSDINTSAEAAISIMRLMSVLKFWIKESGYLQMDLRNDRKSQKKLLIFLGEIQSTSPIKSIKSHAESLMLVVTKLLRRQQIAAAMDAKLSTSGQKSFDQRTPETSVPLPLSRGKSSGIIEDHKLLKIAASKTPLLTRSCSDPKKLGENHQFNNNGANPHPSKITSIRQHNHCDMTQFKMNTGNNEQARGIISVAGASNMKSLPNHISNVYVSSSASSSTSANLLAATAGMTTFATFSSQSQRSLTGISNGGPKGSTSGSTPPKIARSHTVSSTELAMERRRVNFTVPASLPSQSLHKSAPNVANAMATNTSMLSPTIRTPPALSRSSSNPSYEKIEPLKHITAKELGTQLTLIEAELYFANVNPRELTNKAWTKNESKRIDAPGVIALIELFDATAEWVSSEILHPALQAVERAKIITLFIDVADYCATLNNFNTLFELTTGLNAPCIRQLTTTWNLVTAATQEKYACLQQLCAMEDNYRNYRQAFALAEGQPRLPCWFILVKDLFIMDETMQSIEDGLVNWLKFRKIYNVITEALDHQNLNYTSSESRTNTSRKSRPALRIDRKIQGLIRYRLETIRKSSSVLYQLARNANTQESIMFVNSLSEAGFL